jgi:ABC-type lipoprotein export system ATPase subunit
VTLLTVESVVRTYKLGSQLVHAVRDVDLAIETGSFVLLRGPSGSGKTTLLNMMGGLEPPDEGRVLYMGEDIYRYGDHHLTIFRRHQIGFVFQSLALFPRLTALENVDLSLRICGYAPREVQERATYYLDRVGLGSRMTHRVSELSGGEQQRVAIARALAPSPRLLFADEPTGELDQKTGRDIVALLRSLVGDGGLTICLTSHDESLADFADVRHDLQDGSLTNSTKILKTT